MYPTALQAMLTSLGALLVALSTDPDHSLGQLLETLLQKPPWPKRETKERTTISRTEICRSRGDVAKYMVNHYGVNVWLIYGWQLDAWHIWLICGWCMVDMWLTHMSLIRIPIVKWMTITIYHVLTMAHMGDIWLMYGKYHCRYIYIYMYIYIHKHVYTVQ